MKSGGEHQEKSSAQIFRADNKRQKKHNMAWNIVGDKLKKISWVKHVGDLNLQYILSISIYLKVASIQKVRFAFQISKSQKKILQITILSNMNKLFTVMGGNFKFQVQDSDLE